MAAKNMDDETEIKLNDIEKLKLIEFYKENEVLWSNDDPNRSNKIKKNAVKEKCSNHSTINLQFRRLKKPSIHYEPVLLENLRK